jgi:hypothetical protein
MSVGFGRRERRCAGGEERSRLTLDRQDVVAQTSAACATSGSLPEAASASRRAAIHCLPMQSAPPLPAGAPRSLPALRKPCTPAAQPARDAFRPNSNPYPPLSEIINQRARARQRRSGAPGRKRAPMRARPFGSGRPVVPVIGQGTWPLPDRARAEVPCAVGDDRVGREAVAQVRHDLPEICRAGRSGTVSFPPARRGPDEGAKAAGLLVR